MTTFVISPKDLGKFEKRYAGVVRLSIKKSLARAAPDTVKLLRAASAHIHDTGAFADGWKAKSSFTELDIVNAAPHAIYVEGGRAPGSRPPPLQPILEWVLRHGMPASAAWPIARAIGVRGIVARPVLEPNIGRLSDLVVERLREGAAEAVETAKRSAT